MLSEGTHIDASIKRALKTRIGWAADEIDVVDDHGTITLSGPVYSIDERQKVLELVRGTRGVRKVKDHLYFRGYRIEW